MRGERPGGVVGQEGAEGQRGQLMIESRNEGREGVYVQIVYGLGVSGTAARTVPSLWLLFAPVSPSAAMHFLRCAFNTFKEEEEEGKAIQEEVKCRLTLRLGRRSTATMAAHTQPAGFMMDVVHTKKGGCGSVNRIMDKSKRVGVGQSGNQSRPPLRSSFVGY